MRQLFIICFFMFGFQVYSQISIEEKTEGILVSENNKSVLFYQTAPKSHNGQYERTNYIHPLWNVDGTILTEDFPPDHLHQRGVFWAWHQILIDGKPVGDGWALEHYTQEVVHTNWQTHKNGTANLSVKVNWESDLFTQNGKVIPYLEENTDITIHPRRNIYRRIDFEIRLNPLVNSVAIGGSEDDKGYSGFSVRMKLPEDVRFTGPNGEIKPENVAVNSPGFVNVSATFDGEHPGGILMIDSPDNPDYPQPWILRKKNSMQNIKYPGQHPVTITSRDPLVLKYSLVIYKGELSKKNIKKILKQN